MTRRTAITSLLVIAGLLVAACGGESDDGAARSVPVASDEALAASVSPSQGAFGQLSGQSSLQATTPATVNSGVTTTAPAVTAVDTTVQTSETVAVRQAAPAFVPPGAAPYVRNVTVNGKRVSDERLMELWNSNGLNIEDGDYWYDPGLGAWGQIGGPTLVFLLPGLDIGGSLRADASAGDTGVFINGRELPEVDLRGLESILGNIPQAAYWMDERGSFGREGGTMLGNVFAYATTRDNVTGPDGEQLTSATAFGAIGTDSRLYAFVDQHSGCSALVGGGVNC